MKYENGKVSGIKIAYIGGGSRGWAWNLMADLAPEGQLSGEVALYDIDFDRAKINEKIGNGLSERPESSGKWKYTAVRTIDEALSGADFVIASILPGTFDDMESDVHAPEKYGIYQSVGDTAGPGGIIRAMRTLPAYEFFAQKIREICPNAWVINYTNPMTLCVRILYATFPGIKAFGCCHEVFGTQKLLAEMVKEYTGCQNVDRADIKTNVLGINHFTWLDKATWHGQDLLPMYAQFCEKYGKTGWKSKEPENWLNRYFLCDHRVKFDLFKRFGLIAAAGDRHLAEFVPHWYLQNPEMVESWGFALTPVSWRKENAKNLYQRSLDLESGKEKIEIKPSGEEGVRQIKALLGLETLVTNVNLPNKGQMTGVPLNAVVETNAVFRDGELTPVQAGKLPYPVESLVMRHVYNHETIIEGWKNRDKEQIFRAFRNDPAMKCISEADCRSLFAEMLANTATLLPDWLKA